VHCNCNHPLVKQLISFSDELFNFLNNLTDIKEYEYGDLRKIRVYAGLQLEVAEQGIQGKYFIFPFNFDPLWVSSCTGFEEVKDYAGR
jgi:hypothetical protein